MRWLLLFALLAPFSAQAEEIDPHDCTNYNDMRWYYWEIAARFNLDAKGGQIIPSLPAARKGMGQMRKAEIMALLADTTIPRPGQPGGNAAKFATILLRHVTDCEPDPPPSLETPDEVQGKG